MPRELTRTALVASCLVMSARGFAGDAPVPLTHASFESTEDEERSRARPRGSGDGEAPSERIAEAVQQHVELHGFVSQGFILSTGNNYLARSKHGSVEFTEAALNATVSPTESLRLSMQLFTRVLGPIGDYRVNFDWFQLDWHPRDEFGIRAGRVRMPFGLYNDVSDYDPGRVSILLPQSLYSLSARDFLLTVTGAQMYGVLDLGAPGLLEYRGYGGTIFVNAGDSSHGEIDVPYVAGGRLMWEPPVLGLRLGGSFLAAELRGEFGGVRYALPARLWVSSAEYQRGRLLLAAEYGRWHTHLESSDELVIPSFSNLGERYYILSSIEIATWMQVGAYYSGHFEDVDARQTPGGFQHDTALTLRFDINTSWLVKIEGHYMHGTAVVTDGLNRGPPEERPLDWGVLLLKTTAYF